MNDVKSTYSTGDLAKEAGTTVRTVRFYEEAGLLHAEKRACGAHRCFDQREVDRLRLILDLRAAGFSLAQVQTLFGLKRSRDCAFGAADAFTKTLTHYIDSIDKRLSVLKDLRDSLDTMRAAMKECAGCENINFPTSCESCDRVSPPQEERTFDVLWRFGRDIET